MGIPDITIIIPTYNRQPILAKTLRKIENQRTTSHYEVIVVDDNTPGPMPDLGIGKGRRRNWRLLRNNENAGRAATRNRGINAARGEYILMLDDDIWAEPGLVQAHYDKQNEIGGGVVVGAVPPAPENRNTIWNRYTDNRFRAVCRRLREERLDHGLLLTGNVSMPASVLKREGGFNESFKEYSFEDSELGLRLFRKGIKFVHAEKAVGYHSSEETLETICRKAYQRGRSLQLFTELHPECREEQDYKSLSMQAWKGPDIAKNAAKIIIYNKAAIAANKLLIALLAAFGLEDNAFYAISMLRQQYAAAGVKSAISGKKAEG